MLSRKEKETILEELTYFSVDIAYEKGVVVKRQDDYFVDEEENIYDKDEVVTASYNEETRKRIAKFLKPLLRMRGVKDIERIDKNDPDVKKVLKNIRTKNKQIGGGGTTVDDEVMAIQSVIDKHEPQYQAAVFQLIIWAMLRDDLFSVQNKNINSRLEVDIPDDYWDVQEEDDELDAILLDTPIAPIQRKKSEPLEIMVAITTQLTNKYELFAERMGELAAVAFTNLGALSQEFDDGGMFRRELVSILPEYLVRKDSNGNWIDAGAGVHFNTKQDRKNEGNEGEAA